MLRSVLFAAGLAVGPMAAGADDMADIGARLYDQFCASCHGADGQGAGPVAEYLTVSPSDLTGLSEANGGVFPLLAVVNTIDGRARVRGHGGAMPVWGSVFSEELAGQDLGFAGTVLAVRGRVMSLAMYLESIQR